ncbi:MAG TPA: hypothetical protein VIW74_14190 [Pyrinomonadaceae bacterium]
MRKTFFTVSVLVVVTLCPVYAGAQQTQKAEDAGEAALREKAYALLESLAGEIGTMQSPENRARIASNIAGSLWTHNENRARELFALVQQDINTGLQVPNTEDPEDLHTFMVFLRLRMDTINRIVKHDPELAYEFFKATAISPDVKLSESAGAAEQQLEAQLAKQAANSSPDLALQLGRKVLAHGLSDELSTIFRRLNRKHKEQATALYKDIVQKIDESDLGNDWSATNFAVNFATAFVPPEIDEANYSELITVFTKIAVANGCNRKTVQADVEREETCSRLVPVMSVIAKSNPSRGAQFARWHADEEYSYRQPAQYAELQDAASDGSVEDVLALIKKYPDMDDEIRGRAYFKAREDGDVELARKIASEVHQPEYKQRMLADLGEQNDTPVKDDNSIDLEKYLAEIKQPERKAIFLAAVANQIGAKDRKTALKLLNQASQIVDAMKPGKAQLESQLGLAMIYCYLKNDRGFSIMQSLVPKLNELVEASAKLDGVERRYLSNGEWNMTGEGVLGELLTGLANNASFFAHCDFDRAVSLASQFERPEIRIMAQLKLAQGILAGPVKPLPLRYANYTY